jgi:anti-anti-sigma factor
MMELQLLAQEERLVRIESYGAISRVRSGMPDACFEQLGIGDIYSRKVLLDLSKCHYLDSTGVEWLLRCHRWFRERGGLLVIHSTSPVVMQILNIMRMNLVLHLAANEEEARRLASEAPHAN